MEHKILHMIDNHHLLQAKERVLVAVSGGPDSVALLHFLQRHSGKRGWQVACVHVNHQLRGQEAEEDSAYVEQLCEQLAIPCFIRRIDVNAFVAQTKENKQAAARILRYQCYQEVAEEGQFSKVAVAHHAGDQLETMLMRFIRGAGLRGLGGIPLQRNEEGYTLIRPFLFITKQEIEAYCQQHQLQPRHDSSNDSDEYTRNYIRHHVLPHIHQLNPNLEQTIQERAMVYQQEEEYLQSEAQKWFSHLLPQQSEHCVTFSTKRLQEIPIPLQRRVILLLLNYLPIAKRDWQSIHIEQVLELISQQRGSKQIDLAKRIVLQKEHDWASLSVRTTKDILAPPLPFCLQLPEEGELSIPYLPIKICVYRCAKEDFDPQVIGKQIRSANLSNKRFLYAYFDQESMQFPLFVRNRLPGDRLRLKGMEGQQKVKNIFIDQKLSRDLRDLWPIVTDSEHILWIPGIKRSGHALLDEQTTAVVYIIVEMNEEDFFRAGRSEGNTN